MLNSRIERLIGCFATACLLGATATAGAGDVFVVDPTNGPGTDYLTIGSALSAASGGETILVREGDYDERLLITTGVSLVAEVGATVVVDALAVLNTGAQDEVVVRGIRTSEGGVLTVSLRVVDCVGTVWFEDCVIPAIHSQVLSGGGYVQNSASVVFTRCDFQAPTDDLAATLEVVDSTVHVFDCTITGAMGSTGLFGFPGGDAIEVRGGFLHVSGSTLHGGDGGDGPLLCAAAGDGGHGLHMVATPGMPGPTVVLVDSLAEGGAAGVQTNPCDEGVPGSALQVDAGTLTELLVDARSLELSSPARAGQIATATFTGNPGDFVWVNFSGTQGPGFALPAFAGYLVLSLPVKSFFVGALPASGQRVENLFIGGIGSVQGATAYVQATWFDINAMQFGFTAPSAITLLDPSL